MGTPKLHPGASLGGWTLQSQIAKGGNGVVWKCEHRGGQVAALKVLKSDLLEATRDEALQALRARRRQRFLDEIEFLQRHARFPGVTPLIEAFVPAEETPEQRAWFVMPLGVPLQDHLIASGLHLREVVSVTREIASTLATLHQEGSYHRDIKPNNILMIDGKPHLADFGLADFVGKGSNTAESEILGPAFFVAPEMRESGGTADAGPADVYSLAKTMWVSASGQNYPLPGEQRAGVPALSLSAYVTDRRASILDQLLDRSTRHLPTERPTAAEFSEELSAWLSNATIDPTPLRQIAALAGSFGSATAAQQRVLQERAAWFADGRRLMDLIAKAFGPLAQQLTELGLVDRQGNPMTARLLKDENIALWDQWAKAPLFGEQNWMWRGGCGVLTLFETLEGNHIILICGIQLWIDRNAKLTAGGACVCTTGNTSEFDVIWQEQRNARVGSALAESTVLDVANRVIEAAPAAATRFRDRVVERMSPY